MRRVLLPLVLACLVAPAAQSSECTYIHPALGGLSAGRTRLVLLPPRAEIVDRKGDVSRDPGPIAMALVPELHCGLETLGFDVDAHSVLPGTIANDATLRLLVERAWTRLDETSGRACRPRASVDPETMTLSDTMFPLAAMLDADAIVFARSRTVILSRAMRRFIRTLKAVDPRAKWPGPQTDITWVEVVIAEARSGRVLAYVGVAEQGDVSKHPVQIATQAIDRALANLPRPGAPLPDEPSRVVHVSKALGYWIRATGGDFEDSAAEAPATANAAPGRDDEARALLSAASTATGARLVLSRRVGSPGLLVANETERTVRVSASMHGFVQLEHGDAALVDVALEAPWLVVTGLDGAELGRADCTDAATFLVEARILPP